jgi:hypothetical protein
VFAEWLVKAYHNVTSRNSPFDIMQAEFLAQLSAYKTNNVDPLPRNNSLPSKSSDNNKVAWRFTWPCHSSGGCSPASHRGGLGSSPGQVMWDLWWTKWYWGRFSPGISVSSVNSHSTDCSTFIIICHPGLVQIVQLVADVPSGLSLTPPQRN